ncbi:MAG: HAMP domain-containing histidine kinase [Acidobacteriota bacterium]|nr:HAMP domain-containing histidine kinase [Acidobacteriota bacterium]
MTQNRKDVVTAIANARGDLDRALETLEVLATDDRQRVSYSLHALNNYLMVVSSTLQLLRTKLAPGDRDVRRWLDSLKQATNLMMSTARGVLSASGMPPPLLLQASSLCDIAEAGCQAYADIARAKKVRIRWKAPATRDCVLTDCVAAGAVIDNLLSNAVKYSEPGGTVFVTMTVDSVEVSCSVRDSGAGLSEADQAQLFRPGAPLSTRPTAGESSSGYGLAIANDLTTALGGRLSCVSALGQGSCFTFSLPLAQERRVNPAPTPDEPSASQAQ